MTLERRRTALVTGGSRGIGAATALALATHGYNVAFTYRNKQARADRVAARINALDVRALPAQCDITHLDEMTALYSRIAQWSGTLDALILNASGGMERDLVAADPELTEKAFSCRKLPVTTSNRACGGLNSCICNHIGV